MKPLQQADQNRNAAANHKVDLLNDPQVRGEVVQGLYRLIPANPLVAIFVNVLLYWQVVKLPEHKALSVALSLWLLVNVVYFGLYLWYRSRMRGVTEAGQTPAASSALFLRRFFWIALLDAIAFGWVCVGVYWARPDMYAVATVGCAIYLFGDVFKNTIYGKLTNLLPFVIFGPLAATFFYLGTPLFLTLAIILVISIFAMLEFSRTNARTLQLAIKQRYDLARQNDELAELSKKLALERERADAANAAKSNFFTAASHDARQPLQVISLLFQSFQRSPHASADDKKIIEKIDVNLKTIRNLFDRVLDVSRIDSGHVRAQMQALRLQPLFDKLDAQFGELAASRGLWLRFVPSAASVEHDPALLERMLSNLVHNAIKYSNKGGVWVAWRNTRQRIEVRDTGIGISKTDQDLIFDEFAQLNNPARNNEAGLGLGLSIVRRLAQLTKTHFGVRSEPGRGSCFWLKLEKLSDAMQGLTLTPAQEASADTPNLKGMTILYAEDQSDLLSLFSEFLRTAGANVFACASVQEAQAVLATNQRIDILLTDYRLGEVGSGLDLVRFARDQKSLSHEIDEKQLPVVILTGDTAVKDLSAIKALSHCVLLHKPVEFNELAAVLAKQIA